MALDGIALRLITQELAPLIGGRVDKIHQPSHEELVVAIRGRGETVRLFLSASATGARIGTTQHAPENPAVPPNFCMLLRKHVTGAKLTAIRQWGFDRIVYFDFLGTNELLDETTYTLAAELMGRHSNLILIGEDGRVLDSIKRVTPEISQVRPVLPGLRYELPPAQDKRDIDTADLDAVITDVVSAHNLLSKQLVAHVAGLSPVVGRELACRACGDDKEASQLTDAEKHRLGDALADIRAFVTGERPYTPEIVLSADGIPKEWSYLPLTQYPQDMPRRTFDTLCALMDFYYREREHKERVKQRAGDLFKYLQNAINRIERKLAAQADELTLSGDRDEQRVIGDLLNSNLHLLRKGMSEVVLTDYYADPPSERVVKLDPLKAPAQNAQAYYSEYKKMQKAEQALTGLIESGERELFYLQSVLLALQSAVTMADIEDIRAELSEAGYLKRRGVKPQKPKISYHRYESSDGFAILVGRNNRENDQLTMKDAHNTDLWFHTQKIPGSHTVIVTDGREVPDRTLEQAAMIAAFHSKAADAKLVPVDYTAIKRVRKPPGAKPGMVIYDTFKTAVVSPDRETIERLRRKD